nr:MAG TPA: hypothetical protein [Bacteriophage sp.]
MVSFLFRVYNLALRPSCIFCITLSNSFSRFSLVA